MRQFLDQVSNYLLKILLPLTALLTPLFFLPFGTEIYFLNKRYLILVFGTIALVLYLVRQLNRRRIHLTLTPSLMPLLIMVFGFVLSAIIQSPTTYISLIGKTSLIIALTAIYIAVTSSQKNPFVVKSTIIFLILASSINSLVCLYSYIAGTASPTAGSPATLNLTGNALLSLLLSVSLLPAMILNLPKVSSIPGKAILFLSIFLNSANAITQVIQILPPAGQPFFLTLPIAAGWSIAVDIFKNLRTALLGTGPETFLSAFTRLKPDMLNRLPVWDTRFSNSSNEIFELLTTVGLVGTLGFLFSFIQPITASVSSVKPKHSSFDHHFSLVFTITCLAINFLLPTNIILITLSFVAIALLNLSLKLETDNVKELNLNLSTTSSGLYSPLTESPKGHILLPGSLFALGSIFLIWAWFYLTRSYLANLQTAEAIKNLNSNATASYQAQIRAYQLEPQNPTYRINFSQTSLALANAIAGKKDLTEQDRGNVTQLVSQAIREGKNATQLDPANVIVWENLANIYRQLISFAEGSKDWALASYTQAIRLDPKSARLRLDLGGLFYLLKDYDNAIKLFEQALTFKPDYANAHYNLAAAYKQKGMFAAAANSMKTVTQIMDPKSPDYQKALDELKDLESKAATSENKSATPTQPKQSNIELVTPTPTPKATTKIELPKESAPVIPN